MSSVDHKVVADPPVPAREVWSFDRFGVWSGLVGCVAVFVGIVIAHLFPPPPPSLSAEQITDFYRAHTGEIRSGTIIAAFGGALLAPWFGVMAARLRQIPGHGRAAAYCQAGLGAVLILLFVYPLVMLQIVVFRLERPPEVTLALSDFALILFVAPGYTPVVEILFAGLAIMFDRGRIPVFPRWTVWLCIVEAIVTIPACGVIMTKTGPGSWSGWLGWWVPAVAFGIWFLGMSVPMLRRPHPEPN